jgi:hypothetical protein
MRRSKLTATRALWVVLALNTLGGCSSKDMAASAGTGGGGGRDMDASTAGRDDSGAMDSLDGQITDVHGGELCRFGDADTRGFAGHPQLTDVSLALHDQRIALAYHDAGGRPVLELLALSGADADDADDDHLELADVAGTGVRVVATPTGFAASWWQDSELHLARLTKDAEIESSVTLLERAGARTTGMVADAASDRVYLALQDGEGLVLVETSDELSEPSVGELLEDEDSPDGAALFLASSTPSVAWSREGSLLFSSLDGGGSPVVVAEEVTGMFDVAGSIDHVAFAYALRAGDVERVRYRSFDVQGEARLSPQDVQRAPASLRDASIALFGQGYALAYRSLVSRDFPDNTIRIAFMSVTGLVVYQGDVAATSRAGGQSDIVADDDGAVALAWFDSDEVKVHLRRMQCPVALDLCNQ